MKTVKVIVDQAFDEISSKLNPQWQDLCSISGGFVAVHTWLVIWWAKNHLPQLYEVYSEDEKNIILWACLLHDIRKLGTPVF